MKRIALKPHRKISRLRRRRGVLMAWSIWIILFACVIAGSLFNLIWLSGMRNQAHHCASSAALAAGHGYLSDDILRNWQQPFEVEGRIARCQHAAIRIVDEHRKSGPLPSITHRNVKIDGLDAQSALKDPADVIPTRISVSFDENDDAHKVKTFFSGLTGIWNSKLNVCCSVTLEHAPVSFRPAPDLCVPMLPFAICEDSAESGREKKTISSGYWTQNIESGKGSDRFSWNNDRHQFELGPDGLPEITVTIYPGGLMGAADAFVPLSFSATRGRDSSSQMSEWVRNGLCCEDLRTRGLAELAFPGSLPTLPLTTQQINSISIALQQKAGEPCIVCLGTPGQRTSNSSPSWGSASQTVTMKLTRPVAARIVRVIKGTGGFVKVTLQPCVLVTSTSVTAANRQVALNRYIYSVRLIE